MFLASTYSKSKKSAHCKIAASILFVIFFIADGERSFAGPDKGQILFDVPFISQAPTFQWSDDKFQSSCEEASVLMALMWAQAITISKRSEAQAQKILDIVQFEKDTYGSYYDTSPQDTARFARAYSGYEGFGVQKVVRWRDILRALEYGYIVIIPVDGRVLKNPNFKGLGPQEHALLVRGYDYNTEEFITNDPGTRKGEGYRYNRKTLFAAFRDYKTGHKEKGRPSTKTMILVWKKNVKDNKIF